MFDPFNYQCYYPNHIQIVGNYQFTNDYKKFFSNTNKTRSPQNYLKQESQKNISTMKSDSINTKESETKTINSANATDRQNQKEILEDNNLIIKTGKSSLIEINEDKKNRKIKHHNKNENTCQCAIY